ncbi:hypothetical protein LTR37_010161 [Vermiconidia calcicola]|uniref:Uncharacterized protein n=1 Tax=Vermiconidia calcicola TaxID=1690605 RepID=A0ACC3N7H3_9PEZI|nr:hypothetical protein LTR37_010161 [Vermiconidia calcicola]
MARQFGRLCIIAGTIIVFLVILASINNLQFSRSRIGITSEAQQHDSKIQNLEQPHSVGTEHYQHYAADSPTEEEDEPAVPPSPQHTEAAALGEDAKGQEEAQATPTTTSPAAETTTPPSKIIVMGKLMKEDTEWVSQEMTGWQNAIYYVDLPPNVESPTGLKTKMNKAKEATPYLTYIVDNYPNFPDVMVFVHAHRKGMPEAWHNDSPNHDAKYMLDALRLETVLDRGYVNLRCNNEVGCPEEIRPFRDPPLEDKHAEHEYPYVYANFFNVSFKEMREEIPIVATQCCAQFAVSKEQMLKKAKSEYERYKTFIEETHLDDDTSGRVLEYMWHIIFGRDAVHCENVFECWCAVYGRCRNREKYGGG